MRSSVPILISVLAVLGTQVYAQSMEDRGKAPDTVSNREPWSVWPEGPAVIKPTAVGSHLELPTAMPITIGKAIDGPPKNDLLQSLNVSSGINGVMVYAPLVYAEPSQRYIVMRTVGMAPNLGVEKTSCISFHVEASDYLLDPQLSSDGKSLIFKVGWPFDEYSDFDLFLWKFKEGTVQKILSRMGSLNVQWSSNGRWIAHLTGGDTVGEPYPGQHLAINVLDLSTGLDKQVATEVLPYDFSWTSAGELLYASYNANVPSGAAAAAKSVHPNIVEVTPDGKVSQSITDGFIPTESSNGAWNAFDGWPALNKEIMSTGTKSNAHPGDLRDGPWIVFYNRQNGTRIVTKIPAADYLMWHPDSKQVLAITLDRSRTSKGVGSTEAHIVSVSVPDGAEHEIGRLHASDAIAAVRGRLDPQISPLRLSGDGKYLLLSVSEYESFSTTLYNEQRTMCAVSVADGKVTKVAELKNDATRSIGWDLLDWPALASAIK